MKRIWIMMLTSLASIMASCGGNEKEFEQFHTLSSDIQWNKNDPKTFTINVKENGAPKIFKLGFRYATGYMFDKMMIRMKEISPEGNTTLYDLEIPIRDQNGEFIGDKGYDIIDLEYVIDSTKKYPSIGNYTYTLEPNIPNVDPVHFAMEVGLILEVKPSP